ncbi:MAG: SDR family NAD(P)-dependent oxidoreductase [Deltaproteobacteria bacterium]|nr:SDR family NAD(P)-dependent oxidoreductase [Deltaproteobacteria bacterium]
MEFEGATAVVTGGASGLGRAFSEELGRRGGKVLLTDIDAEGAAETVRLVQSAGGEARFFEADVRSEERMQEIAREAADWFGPVDLLVNNAGVGVAGPFDQLDLDDWRYCVDINLWGVIYGCYAFVPGMKRRGRGYIINVASSAGLLALPDMGPYNVTKAGVIALSETLYGELRVHGVHVTALCPTFFRTNILENMRGVHDVGAKRVANKMMDASKVQAPDVARAALAAVHRGQLYSVPMRDGRMYWRLKRALPAGFAAIVDRVARSGLLK